jgi:hypothetical protein
MENVNQFLDGLLLGDGHLQKSPKNRSARYGHSCKEKEYRKKGLICISKKSIHEFLNYIGECPVSCYQYKWETSRFTFKQPKY